MAATAHPHQLPAPATAHPAARGRTARQPGIPQPSEQHQQAPWPQGYLLVSRSAPCGQPLARCSLSYPIPPTLKSICAPTRRQASTKAVLTGSPRSASSCGTLCFASQLSCGEIVFNFSILQKVLNRSAEVERAFPKKWQKSFHPVFLHHESINPQGKITRKTSGNRAIYHAIPHYHASFGRRRSFCYRVAEPSLARHAGTWSP